MRTVFVLSVRNVYGVRTASMCLRILADRSFRSADRLNANDVHRAISRKIVVALGRAVRCTERNATATPPRDTEYTLAPSFFLPPVLYPPLSLSFFVPHSDRRTGVYNLSSPVIPTISAPEDYGGRIAVGFGPVCGVWEGILIQHATHDVGPTMTAPIPALIFHRFYSRPSPPRPSPLVPSRPYHPFAPLALSLCPSAPSRSPLPVFLPPSWLSARAPPPTVPPRSPTHSYLDMEPSLPPQQPDILYRETCLSLRPASLNKQLSK